MPPKKCQALLSQLSEYVDGSLDPRLCKVLERHLKTCKNCRVVLNTMRKTIDLYRTVGESEEMPSEVRERLFHRLNLSEYLRKRP
ncbi:zf-HC2 domain-containing protein [uncultured Thermanaerothrix sp.]|uniref:anti-sigma factor family protein n=1 Tax=uncultured Thermanaerothrix sp. TaxID=1195149 RepID=UPI0026111EDF|nr:zf-HC2 domain-containing protein [uncultured Thermanaerothrix sp.]